MKKVNIGIWGWWQGNNLGDNWIKKTLSIAFPEAVFVPTSIKNFKKFDFMICGGGGLFIYDVISPWNRPEHLKIPYGIIGLGAEFPHNTSLAQKLEKKSKFFFVRDKYSIDCMKVSERTRSFDCTFFAPLDWVSLENIDIEQLFYVWRDGHELLDNDKFKKYINCEEDITNKWNKIINKRFKKIKYDDFQTNDDKIEDRIGNAGFVISGRYHGIVAAIQRGLPFIAIDICPKIRALLKDAGLEEYCIKISEYSHLDELILHAINNIDSIREHEWKYRDQANRKVRKDVYFAWKEIYRSCKPYKAIHYGSYWMGKNDIVNTMSDDLSEITHLKKIDLREYSRNRSRRIRTALQAPNTMLTILDHKRVMFDVLRHRPDFIVMNSAGLVFEDKTFKWLKQLKIKTIGIELSDPDVYPYNGAVYADKYDAFYTNSKFSYLKQYDHKKVNIHIMPFAASTKHHYCMPDIDKEYDVVIVGHARPDRLEIVNALEKKFKVGTYGNGWKHSLGIVNGKEHVKAINRGKMYLSFSKTMAGFDNVKVGLFEAMACNQVVITSYMEELNDYFEIGKEVLCYKSNDEIIDLIDYYLNHEAELEEIRQRAYMRFLSEHTYVDRWMDVIEKM